jgi:hypothetical protein
VSKGDFKCQGRGYLYNNQVTLTNIWILKFYYLCMYVCMYV